MLAAVDFLSEYRTQQAEDWPKPVAELEDTGEPYRASEKPREKVVGETLASSLCRHSLYAATCPRCKYGSRTT